MNREGAGCALGLADAPGKPRPASQIPLNSRLASLHIFCGGHGTAAHVCVHVSCACVCVCVCVLCASPVYLYGVPMC